MFKKFSDNLNAYFVPVVTNFSFKGRTSRKQYWMYVLFNLIISNICFNLPQKILAPAYGESPTPLYGLFVVLGLIYSFGMLVQSIAIMVRRLHDIGKSGWWALLLLTVIGVFVLIYFLCQKGDEQANAYGDVVQNPL